MNFIVEKWQLNKFIERKTQIVQQMMRIMMAIESFVVAAIASIDKFARNEFVLMAANVDGSATVAVIIIANNCGEERAKYGKPY